MEDGNKAGYDDFDSSWTVPFEGYREVGLQEATRLEK